MHVELPNQGTQIRLAGPETLAALGVEQDALAAPEQLCTDRSESE